MTISEEPRDLLPTARESDRRPAAGGIRVVSPSDGDDSPPGQLSGARLLLVDHDPSARETISRVLEADGADVAGASSGEAALELLGQSSFDLMILDTRLPGISGFETLHRIRERSDLPVIIVTSAGTLDEHLAAFDTGADDYLEKPIEASELGRRARALLRRARGAHSRTGEELRGPAGLVLRLHSYQAMAGDVALDLTPKEFAVLRFLLDRRGEVVRPDDLSLAIWGYGTFGSRNFVEAHISRLRAKLAKAGADQIVTTIRGVGYVIR